MAGYIRQDTGNNIENDEIADATYLDQEYDAIQAAFHASTGHAHNGDVGEGAPILSVGPVQDFLATSSLLRPKTTAAYDLGSTTFRFKDLYLSGNVVATGGLSGQFNADNGTVALPSITFASDLNTGLYRVGADVLGFSTAGTSRLTIGAGGLVNVVGNASVGGTLTVTGVATADSFSGDLNATQLTSGTVNTNRIAGSYTGITGTGVLNAGSINTGFGNIDVGTNTITGGALVSTGSVTATQNFVSSTTNVVLASPAAGGGGVFLRPNGPASSTGQTVLASTGNMVINGNLTTTGTITGDLAASNLTGTIPSARISGSYTGITTVGVLTNLGADDIKFVGSDIHNRTSGASLIRISGGSAPGAGAVMRAFGGSHATNANQIVNDASEHRFRSTDGSSNFAILTSTELTLGTGIDIVFSGSGAASTRTNLGLGSVATGDQGTGASNFRTNAANDTHFMIASNNLSQLTNLTTARNNLGLGSMATLDSGTAGSQFRTNTQNDARFHISGTNTLAVGDLPTGAAAGDWIQDQYAFAGVGQVGTYAMLRNDSGTNYGAGVEAPGGDLSYAHSSGTSGVSPSGTWKAMGQGNAGTVTIWLRVS